MVYNQTLEGKTVEEGRAILIEKQANQDGSEWESWVVRFESDPYDRFYRRVRAQDKIEGE